MRRARLAGLLVRPRFAAGTTDVVVGYSAAVRPVRGERPVWFGGGRLDRDLTLPRLREGWADTAQAATAAAAEWTAAARHRRPVAPGAETQVVDGGQLEAARAELAGLRDRLVAVPVTDHGAWARTAADTAGVLGALSAWVETTPGPIARTADQLARSAQLRFTAARSTGRCRRRSGGSSRSWPSSPATSGRGPGRAAAARADRRPPGGSRRSAGRRRRPAGPGPGRHRPPRPAPVPHVRPGPRRHPRADATSLTAARGPGRTTRPAAPRAPGTPDPDNGLDR